MTKLLEQVKEIQRRAHVCPICGGAKTVETYPFDWLRLCGECDGTGELPAPDIDTLVGVIEVLEAAVVDSGICKLYCGAADWRSERCPEACEQKAAWRLITDGLPGDGHV